MKTETPNNEGKDYEIPCQLLPATEFDMSEAIPPEQLANLPVGGFVRDELLHEPIELDFSEEEKKPVKKPMKEKEKKET